MTIALLAALVAVNIAYLILLDRRDKRERAERGDLLQRIQAPAQAVAELSTAVTVDGPLYRNLGDRDELPDELVVD